MLKELKHKTEGWMPNMQAHSNWRDPLCSKQQQRLQGPRGTEWGSWFVEEVVSAKDLLFCFVFLFCCKTLPEKKKEGSENYHPRSFLFGRVCPSLDILTSNLLTLGCPEMYMNPQFLNNWYTINFPDLFFSRHLSFRFMSFKKISEHLTVTIEPYCLINVFV